MKEATLLLSGKFTKQCNTIKIYILGMTFIRSDGSNFSLSSSLFLIKYICFLHNVRRNMSRCCLEDWVC